MTSVLSRLHGSAALSWTAAGAVPHWPCLTVRMWLRSPQFQSEFSSCIHCLSCTGGWLLLLGAEALMILAVVLTKAVVLQKTVWMMLSTVDMLSWSQISLPAPNSRKEQHGPRVGTGSANWPDPLTAYLLSTTMSRLWKRASTSTAFTSCVTHLGPGLISEPTGKNRKRWMQSVPLTPVAGPLPPSMTPRATSPLPTEQWSSAKLGWNHSSPSKMAPGACSPEPWTPSNVQPRLLSNGPSSVSEQHAHTYEAELASRTLWREPTGPWPVILPHVTRPSFWARSKRHR